MHAWIKGAFWAIVIAALAATAFFLRRDNAKLAVQAAALRQRATPVARLAEENRHTRELLTRSETDTAAAARSIHADVMKLRGEIREFEERAQAAAAQQAAAAAAVVVNRDPEKGLARLENFQNVGRGSPGAAVQTLIWAALKADEPTLVASLALMDDAREEAEQLLAHLPDAARAKYPAPENLAALAITNQILRADAAQITTTTATDSRHAIVGVRIAGIDGDEKLPTELTLDGWKVLVPKKMILSLEKRLNPPPVGKGG